MIPEGAEYVVCYHRELVYQPVRSKFTGWKAFHVHVGFQLAVELFHGSVLVVIFDDVPVAQAGIVPPSVQLNVRDQQHLPVLGNRPLSNLEHNADCGLLHASVHPGIGDWPPCGSDIDVLAVARLLVDGRMFFRKGEPILFGLAARISFRDEMMTALHDDAYVFHRVIP